MKKYILSLFIMIVATMSVAQPLQITNYNRASVAVVALPNATKFNNDLVKAFENYNSVNLNDRFFYNPTRPVLVQTRNDKQEIVSMLKRDHYAAQSLMPWRNLDTLINRTSYNLSAQQRSQLANSVRGLENVRDERWFMQVLRSNYILVLSINRVEDIKNITSKKQLVNLGVQMFTGSSFSTIKSDKIGYVGNVTAYLYHIPMKDVDYMNFLTSYEDDAKHLSQQYEVELVQVKEVGIDGTSDKSTKKDKETLLREFVSEAANQALFSLGENYLPIKPKAMALSGRPVKAEIGKKEGLRPDDLVYAYELRENSKGLTEYNKKGTYRVKTVGNNQTDATATSTFYNVNWGGAKEGMVMIPKEEVGISISPGVYFYPKMVFRADLGFNLSRLARSSRSARIKLLVNLGYSGQFTDENGFFEHYATTHGNADFCDANGLQTIMYGVGIQKDFYILPFMQLSPALSVMVEHSWYKDRKIIDDAMGYFQLPYNYGRILYPQFDIKLPINITYNLKIVPIVSYALKINSLSFGAGLSSENNGEYSPYIEKKDRLFAGCSIQLDL